jgi:hypothetical protein
VRRDWDCIRAILLALEDKGEATRLMRSSAVPDFDAETVCYHMQLMIEAGLINGKCKDGTTLYCVAKSMTWQGHELLDKIRSQTVWNRIKSLAREQSLPLSVEAIKMLGSHALSSVIGG